MKTVMETFEEWVQTQPDKALYTFLDINDYGAVQLWRFRKPGQYYCQSSESAI